MKAMLTLLVVGLVLLVPGGVALWSTWMPGDSATEPLRPLGTEEQTQVARLEADVRALAEGIGERNMHTPGSMEASVDWLMRRFREAGVEPELHRYELRGGRYAGETAVNVIAEVPGTETADTVVIVGAHYDTVPGSPGANDNASGVAVLLALAEWVRRHPQPRTVRFIAFANEEQPFHQTQDMGSEAYARERSDAGDTLVAMMALDGLGYFSSEPGSQAYPFDWIRWFYPQEGNFIGFITRSRDAPTVRRAIGAFRSDASIPSEGAALPPSIPGVGWSDHRPFWDEGYVAFLVTDTLPFRDPQYHRPGDTPDRLDFQRLARVGTGLRSVVRELARPAGR